MTLKETLERKKEEANERIGELMMRNSATQNMLSDPNSVLHCPSCHRRLSLLKCIVHALGKKRGETYPVRCRCGNTITIKKGQAGDDIDAAWRSDEQA